MIRLWLQSEFKNRFNKVQGHTVVSAEKAYVLLQMLKQAIHFPGHIAEIGVYKGGTAKLINEHMKDSRVSWKLLHLFDTFEGMPKVDPTKDMHKEGDFNDTSLKAVSDFVGPYQTIFHQGLFPQSAHQILNEKFCFVHVDCDIYTSVKACCDFFYPRIDRGIIVFDDYGAESCPGAKAAVDEFFSHAARIEEPIYLPTGQAIIFKSDT